jgi:hypothetical protein
MPTTAPPPDSLDAPPALLAIAHAARLAGDRELERAARRLLRERHGIEVSFRRSQRRQQGVSGGG